MPRITSITVRVDEFDYNLPEELIAQQPLTERDASRMLVVDRAAGTFEDRMFHAIFLPMFMKAIAFVLKTTRACFLPGFMAVASMAPGGSRFFLRGKLLKTPGKRWFGRARRCGPVSAFSFRKT